MVGMLPRQRICGGKKWLPGCTLICWPLTGSYTLTPMLSPGLADRVQLWMVWPSAMFYFHRWDMDPSTVERTVLMWSMCYWSQLDLVSV